MNKPTPELDYSLFIEHIQAHLQPGEEVVCKICGRTAKDICTPSPDPNEGQAGGFVDIDGWRHHDPKPTPQAAPKD